MKLLQNKSTREIGCLVCSFEKSPKKITVVEYIDGMRGSKVWYYNSLAELNADWEDYEGHKDHWHIGCEGDVFIDNTESCLKSYSSIGNDFETKEEAEKAVEKLKAFMRLKDKGFEFRWIDMQTGQIKYSFFLEEGQKVTREDEDGLLLLFGGEE